MSQALNRGFTPAEVAFMCEMEQITVIPRQRLDSIPLLSGSTPALRPPHRASLPLWLALLLKRQRRADIVPPPWLHADRLTEVLKQEIANPTTFTPAPSIPLPKRLVEPDATTPSEATITSTPPFDGTSTVEHAGRIHADAVRTGASLEEEEAEKGRLPYHWVEMGQLLLADAASDIPDAEAVRRLLRDLREVRMAKVRSRISKLENVGQLDLTGIGAMELCESRGFLTGVLNGMRKISKSREDILRERAEEQGAGRADDGDGQEDSDEDMVM